MQTSKHRRLHASLGIDERYFACLHFQWIDADGNHLGYLDATEVETLRNELNISWEQPGYVTK